MANVVGEVQVRVRPDGSNFAPELQAILNRATGQATQGAQAINQALGQTSRGAEQLGQVIDNSVGRKFAEAAIQAAGFTAAVYATKAAIEGTIGKLAGLFDQLAQAKAGFNAIIGDRAGTKLLEEIREFARVSPFVTQELVNYSQQLLGVGLAAEKIVPLLRDTGNVIASVGGDTQNLSRVLFTMTQIQTVGRLTGQDAMQLQSALIPITKMLSSYLGKTTVEVKKLQEQGAISAESVFAAIQAAGQKVPGAMDNAVRNIAGARAVLSDTIQIMMQDAPALNMIYQDIVKGIQSLAAALGDPKVQGAISGALEQIGVAYEKLKPLVEGFIETAGSASLVGLQSFTQILTLLGDVLEQIPVPVMDALGKLLAVMVTLQAPKYLFSYVNNLKSMAGLLPQLAKGMGSQNVAMVQGQKAGQRLTTQNYLLAESLRSVGAASQMAEAQSRILTDRWNQQTAGTGPKTGIGQMASRFANSRPGQMAGGAAVIGAGMAGMALQGQAPTNSAAQTAGGALTYGAMGFALGGPVGGLAGAGIGAAVGYMNAAEAKAEEHAAKMKELGERSANNFLNQNYKAFTEATSEGSALLESQMAELRAQQSAIMGTGGGVVREGFDKGIFDGGLDSAGIREFADSLGKTNAEMDVLKAKYDEVFGAIGDNLLSTLALIDDPEIQALFSGEMFNRAAWDAQNGGYVTTTKSLEEIEDGARKYGLSLQDLANMGPEAIEKVVTQINKLSTATQEAIRYAGIYNAEYEKAKGEAEALYGGRAKQIGLELGAMRSEKSAIDAVAAAYQNQGDVQLQLAADQAVLQAAEQAYLTTKAELVAKGIDQERAMAQATIESENLIAGSRVTGIASLKDLAAWYGYTKEELADVLNLQAALDPEIKIVVTADTQQALSELAKLLALEQSILAASRTQGPGASGLGGVNNISRDSVLKQYEDILASIRSAPPALTAKPAAGPKATTPKSSVAGPTGPTWEEKIVSAGDALRSSIEAAMESVKQAADAWKGSIKEATEYEPAVSASRALRNTTRQIADIGMITAGIKTLKSRGLSEAAIESLDINSITDARQIKKLLATDPAKLQALSAAVGNRDLLASTLSSDRQAEQSRRTITQAILEAAKLLGYTPTEAQAKAIAAEFTINEASDAQGVMAQILATLSGGKVSV